VESVNWIVMLIFWGITVVRLSTSIAPKQSEAEKSKAVEAERKRCANIADVEWAAARGGQIDGDRLYLNGYRAAAAKIEAKIREGK
jgi:hypothetical protein